MLLLCESKVKGPSVWQADRKQALSWPVRVGRRGFSAQGASRNRNSDKRTGRRSHVGSVSGEGAEGQGRVLVARATGIVCRRNIHAPVA